VNCKIPLGILFGIALLITGIGFLGVVFSCFAYSTLADLTDTWIPEKTTILSFFAISLIMLICGFFVAGYLSEKYPQTETQEQEC
jgi:hypothetical protein